MGEGRCRGQRYGQGKSVHWIGCFVFSVLELAKTMPGEKSWDFWDMFYYMKTQKYISIHGVSEHTWDWPKKVRLYGIYVYQSGR